MVKNYNLNVVKNKNYDNASKHIKPRCLNLAPRFPNYLSISGYGRSFIRAVIPASVVTPVVPITSV